MFPTIESDIAAGIALAVVVLCGGAVLVFGRKPKFYIEPPDGTRVARLAVGRIMDVRPAITEQFVPANVPWYFDRITKVEFRKDWESPVPDCTLREFVNLNSNSPVFSQRIVSGPNNTSHWIRVHRDEKAKKIIVNLIRQNLLVLPVVSNPKVIAGVTVFDYWRKLATQESA